jgi:hypothetical protein
MTELAKTTTCVLTKIRYCIRNYSPINRESNKEAIREGNKTSSESPVSTQSRDRLLATTESIDNQGGGLALHAHASLTSGHALFLFLASPSPKSQVTRIPHAGYDNGPVYIDESWREKRDTWKYSSQLLCMRL